MWQTMHRSCAHFGRNQGCEEMFPSLKGGLEGQDQLPLPDAAPR